MNVQVQPNVTTAIKDYDRAIVDYSDAIKLNPNYVAACNYRAQVHSLKRDFRRAIADYDETITLDLSNASAYSGRGSVYEAIGE